MGHIYKELHEIPLPEGAKGDGNRVYMLRDIGGGNQQKVYIGVFTRKDLGLFHANDAFLAYYPELWQKYYGSKMVPKHHLALGLYDMTLAIAHKLGLYDTVYEVFGPQNANVLMDFAMYSIRESSNVAQLFEPAMAGSVLFEEQRVGDTWLSEMFSKKLNEDLVHQFRVKWVERCRENGITTVWLSVDGSNNNCELKDSQMAEPGHARSRENVPVVSYIWALSAKDGTPVTWFMEEGSVVDAKAFSDIIEFLEQNGIGIEGMILDRGFLTEKVLISLQEKGYDYLVMLKDDTYGFTTVYEEYAHRMHMKVDCLIGKGGRFGLLCGQKKIFKNADILANIGLFYDESSGSDRKVALLDKIFAAKSAAEEAIQRGEKPSITGAMMKYLKVVEVRQEEAGEEVPSPGQKPNGTVASEEDSEAKGQGAQEQAQGKKEAEQLPIHYEVKAQDTNCDTVLFKKGFSGLASSREMSAAEMDRLYDLRDASEKQYMISKSMLGQSVFRGHSDDCNRSRGLSNFIAAIIRNDFQKSCKELDMPASVELEDLDNRLYLIYTLQGSYSMVMKLSRNQLNLFQCYGYTQRDLETIAGDINERMRASRGNGTVSQYHEPPAAIRARLEKAAQKDSTAQAVDTSTDKGEEKPADKPKRSKGGRPKGSKNKKTLEREARMKEAGETIPEPRHTIGRPLGSKNKKTLEREANGELPKKPKAKGRPKGSRDSKPRHRRTNAELKAEEVQR